MKACVFFDPEIEVWCVELFNPATRTSRVYSGLLSDDFIQRHKLHALPDAFFLPFYELRGHRQDRVWVPDEMVAELFSSLIAGEL